MLHAHATDCAALSLSFACCFGRFFNYRTYSERLPQRLLPPGRLRLIRFHRLLCAFNKMVRSADITASNSIEARPMAYSQMLTTRQLPLGLLTAAQGHPMLVELKNGETLNGHLVNCDNWMNLTLKEVVQTSPEGDRFYRLPEVYVRGNNVCDKCSPRGYLWLRTYLPC
jgi:small nuclear ribonucleoprotein (snRNP)-like protein